jgi:hypothetical protein
MELIVLKGKANVGKTATINYVYNELIKKNWKEVEPYREISNGDFWAVLEKDEIILGIVSQGDYVGTDNSVQNHLNRLEKKSCSKVVCAQTNSKPSLQKVIDKYNNIPIEMSCIREINQKVEEILALV